MEVIGIRATTHQNGEFVLESLKAAVEKKRVALDDIAMVTRDENGKIKLVQTHRKGIVGRIHDRGIDDGMMKTVGEHISNGEAVVFALGADASVDAVAAKVVELTGGDVKTFVIREEDDGLVMESVVDVPEQTGLTVRMPYS